MRVFLLIVFLLTLHPIDSFSNDRYWNQDKILYEQADESEVLNVYVSQGYSTVLELPEKPSLVSVGDYSLLQIEVPKKAKTIILKPIENKGETNLFVFTPNHRFNYRVIITDDSKVDYVVDVDSVQSRRKTKMKQDFSISQIMRVMRNYSAHEKIGTQAILPKQLKRTKVFKGCSSYKVRMSWIDVFQMKDPHVLVFHLKLKNMFYKEIRLNESKTYVIINDQEYPVDYIVFDQNTLKREKSTDAYLILKDSHVSLENDFRFMIGVDDEEYTCR